jgi:hypothetical protein
VTNPADVATGRDNFDANLCNAATSQEAATGDLYVALRDLDGIDLLLPGDPLQGVPVHLDCPVHFRNPRAQPRGHPLTASAQRDPETLQPSAFAAAQSHQTCHAEVSDSQTGTRRPNLDAADPPALQHRPALSIGAPRRSIHPSIADPFAEAMTAAFEQGTSSMSRDVGDAQAMSAAREVSVDEHYADDFRAATNQLRAPEPSHSALQGVPGGASLSSRDRCRAHCQNALDLDDMRQLAGWQSDIRPTDRQSPGGVPGGRVALSPATGGAGASQATTLGQTAIRREHAPSAPQPADQRRTNPTAPALEQHVPSNSHTSAASAISAQGATCPPSTLESQPQAAGPEFRTLRCLATAASTLRRQSSLSLRRSEGVHPSILLYGHLLVVQG